MTDQELLKWARNAHARASATGFIRTFADAVLCADPDNYAILRDAAEVIAKKYPVYTEEPWNKIKTNT